MIILKTLLNLLKLKKSFSRQLSLASKLRICYIAPFGLITKGTTAARLLPIAQTMAARGHQVRLVVPAWDDPAASPDLQLDQPRHEKREGVELVYVPVQFRPQPISIPLLLAQAALEFQPDVIHIFKPKAFSGLTALVLNLLKIPFVLDTDDWEGRGGYNEVSPYTLPQKILFNWQEQNLPRRAASVTVASRTLETQVWGLGVARHQVFYLPNGVAAEKYSSWNALEVIQQAQANRAKFGFATSDLVLIAYTRFVEFQPERLLAIFELVLKKLPATEAVYIKLLVVGGGFYNEEKSFAELAEKRGLTKYLTLTGRVSPQEIPALLRCGDIALYPFEDNLINRARSSAKFLDLLLAERPVVTEAVGELREYLLNSRGGYLVPPGDNVAFAQAVLELAALSVDKRNEYGQAACRRLQTLYTWQQLTESLENFYRQLES